MDDPVVSIRPLGFPWETADPFLFCVHHDDAYPAGDAQLGPAASLEGRELGQDFAGKDGWRMYHGRVVPGFPQHPHRGFETVTIVRRGYIDHSDSLGATARFGPGDVQWLTAGAGIVHAEMFPLLQTDAPNPLELFQIWLNLAGADKMAPPYFAMLWNQDIPEISVSDPLGHRTSVSLIAGSLGDQRAPAPPPRSWAARPENGVAIWDIRMQAGAKWQLPAADPALRRTLYFFRGSELRAGSRELQPLTAATLAPGVPVVLEAGAQDCEILLLGGRPIGEPVVQYGPFVMNSKAEIQRALSDYQRSQFGGWPWPQDGPVHPREAGRFARHIDGHLENADQAGVNA
jgi:redox-sensitive bicupin YhaK (pirin superfamily)